MSLLLNPNPSSALLSHKSPKLSPKSLKPLSLTFSRNPKFVNLSVRSSSSFNDPADPPSKPDTSSEADSEKPAFVDEWGEKSEPEPEPTSKFSGSDPPKNEDEWGGSEVDLGNGSPVADVGVNVGVKEDGDGKLWELKRALVDTVYGSDLGFRASAEVRAEAFELVSQLEAANPTPAPTENPELLDGNWVLVYTAFSELLPLLAVGSIPLVKVEKIGQSIDTSSLTIENSITLSSPVSTLSFSASASFEVRSPTRIQVEFKEGTFKPPEIKSSIDLPESINVFGQNINLSSIQQSLSPLQNAVEGIARTISGQPPLKIPIPGERTKSWLLITYLDKDLRISRGDGGLFVLVKEGSALLDY
ncbi:plastoglobulin-1, chloroplastic [Sesamum indicum]|uniref:Plastoglobulin-1, chloroplastic n=1 Tax=Sesamum indicum TaxID=4182 RepID=A0A6I9TET1_SESIN|nr:plastoglobulin-1, chloroplastic [Sesamum indicum]